MNFKKCHFCPDFFYAGVVFSLLFKYLHQNFRSSIKLVEELVDRRKKFGVIHFLQRKIVALGLNLQAIKLFLRKELT